MAAGYLTGPLASGDLFSPRAVGNVVLQVQGWSTAPPS